MSQKLRIGILFGGKSQEHEISLLSACNIVNALDKKKYEVILIGVDKEQGQWYIQEPYSTLPHQQPEKLMVVSHLNNLVTLMPSHSKNHTLLTGLMTKEQLTVIDVIFPVLHGPFGEDGTIQGLLKLAHVPFVGSDIMSSAICMDKDVSKRLVQAMGILTPSFKTIYRYDLPHLDIETLLKEIGLPCFVKPANLGSSIGITKVKTKSDLLPAIQHAFQFDRKVLVEKAIEGREIECAILGNDQPIAAIPGEIIPHAEFYDYQAKYEDPEGAEVLAIADLSADIQEKIQRLALQIFRCLDCSGLARVDFFLTQNGEIYFNEINTLPGFTQISQYPKMWEASGISYSELLDRLIQLALDKFDGDQVPEA